LDYLSKKKIIHRDIKPSNILLNKSGEAKISDFGLSKQMTASINAFHSFHGTYMYMSPERLKTDDYGFDSDIWSLGVSIAECAVGKFPYNLKRKKLDFFNKNRF
jgi:serine/threonine protein kinase